MTLLGEIAQLLAIVIFPVFMIMIGVGVLRNWLRSRGAVSIGGVLILVSYFVLLRDYTWFSIGVFCPDGQRMVEVAPSLFARSGDQQTCVPDTLSSSIALAMAQARPILQVISMVLTAVLFLSGIIFFKRRTRVDNKS